MNEHAFRGIQIYCSVCGEIHVIDTDDYRNDWMCPDCQDQAESEAEASE